MKSVFVVLICVVVLEGICSLIVANQDKPTLSRRLLVVGVVLSVICVVVFIAARQPYAGIVCFALLVVKGLLLSQGK